MKFSTMGLGLAVMFVAMPLAAQAQSAAMEQAQKPVVVGNKVCPVSGRVIAGSGMEPVTVEYKGRIYNLCCAGCPQTFLKDPEKYSKIADQEVMKDQEQAQDKSMGGMPMGDMPAGHKM
ncbi:MAG: TRASH domain-containing protein [Candidatus Omnitrophica bacterium]|nr:TRASH domain-containing protein [Candidatus Omnitrophota bacterium]